MDLRFYNSIVFRNNKDKKINCHNDLCIAQIESSQNVTETPILSNLILS